MDCIDAKIVLLKNVENNMHVVLPTKTGRAFIALFMSISVEVLRIIFPQISIVGLILAKALLTG